MDSNDKMHFFFEEDAVDDKGKLIIPKEEAVEKIAHGSSEKFRIY